MEYNKPLKIKLLFHALFILPRTFHYATLIMPHTHNARGFGGWKTRGIMGVA